MACAEEKLSTHLCCKFKDESANETLSVCVSQDGAVFTGHDSKLNVWIRTQDDSKTKSCKWSKTGTLITPTKGDVNAICEATTASRGLLIFSLDNCILFYDRQNLTEHLRQVCHSKDEINQLSVNAKGNLLCACDDSGEIKLIDTSSYQVVKTLTAHDNICSTVKFIPRKPWEILSGGLDCKLIRWDFNRGRSLCSLNQSELSNSNFGNCAINPPMVHTLDVFPSTSIVVCGLGNGTVCVYSMKGGRDMELMCTSDLHSASISCVCAMEVSKSDSKIVDQFVVSGGDDKRLCVSKLVVEDGSKAGRKYHLELLSQVNHGSKINCLALHRNCKQFLIFIVDLTCFVSVYKFAHELIIYS